MQVSMYIGQQIAYCKEPKKPFTVVIFMNLKVITMQRHSIRDNALIFKRSKTCKNNEYA